jgi:hypothetical protein
MTTNSNKPVIYGAVSFIAIIYLSWMMLSENAVDKSVNAEVKPLSHWHPISDFKHARRAFAASTNGSYIYIIGGIDDQNRYLSSVEYAPILADGSLGAWQLTTPLNEARFYLSSVVIGDYIYTIGGANGPLGEDNIPSAAVERAKILANGKLGDWEFQPYMTSLRRGLQSLAYGDHIYALGGYNGAFLKTVERADVDRDGNISEWTQEPESFIVDRYIHCAALHNNRIYLIAGHVENQDVLSYGDVESALIHQDGRLSPWRIEQSKLNTPRFIASATSLGQYLYIAGGHDGANRLTSVEYAPIQGDGKLGHWIQSLPLQTARSATALVANKNVLYVFGGGGGDNVLNSIESAKQLPNGKLIAVEPGFLSQRH